MLKGFKILMCLLIALSTAGCFDSNEVDDLAYIVSIGVDKGEVDRVRLTVQYATFSQSVGGGGGIEGESDGTMIVTIDCPSLYTGLDMLSTSTSRRFNLFHIKYFVVSKEMAQQGEMDRYINALIRYNEIRRNMFIFVSRGKARDFILENKPVLGDDIIKTIELAMEQAYRTGLIPYINIGRFNDALKSTTHQPVSVLVSKNDFKGLMEQAHIPRGEVSGGHHKAGEVPRRGGVKAELMGTAVFNGGTMVGELKGDETRVFMMITGEYKRGFLTIPDPQKPDDIIVLDVRDARRPTIKTDLSGNSPRIEVLIRLEGNIVSTQSKINYESDDLQPILERAFEQEIKGRMDRLIAKTQKTFKSDIFNFGKYVSREFATIQQWEEYNWLGRYPQAVVSTKVEFTIRRSGMMLETAPAKQAEEENQ
ncbi:MAG: Ger(x)C family spore germination protein [Mahellales bacterium]|jgi:spore germination protein KC